MSRRIFIGWMIALAWLALGQRAVATEIVETQHAITVAGHTLDYTAATGLLTVEDARFGTTAEFFFVAYSLIGAEPGTRPLTFAFNGGPGASAAFLHLLALGPYRIVLPDDGTLPEPPATLTVNEQTWLTFTDLVLIDPMGTGFSRCLDCGGIGYEPYWGVLQDRNSVADFIVAYLDWAERWTSPVYVAGESYGGVRGPLLLNYLPGLSRPIQPQGGVLISPAIDMGACGSNGNNYNLKPFALSVPSFARVAVYHDKAQPAAGQSMAQFMTEVERFAMSDLLLALAEGDALDPAERSDIFGRLSSYIGLSEAFCDDLDGRIGMLNFSKELLKTEGLLTGWFDGTITGPDPDPASEVSTKDYSSDRVNALIQSVIEDYLSNSLGFTSQNEYITLNYDAEPMWDWSYPPTAQGDGQGWVIVGDELAAAMNADQNLKVALLGGYYDTVVPYYADQYLINHLDLNAGVLGNISLTIYEGGHMVYSHKDAREQFTADLKRFYGLGE